MPLSTLPSGGPTLPAGAQKVSLKTMADENGTSAANDKVDVTVLGDTERVYASAPLKEPGGGGASGATAGCSASGLLQDGGPEVDDNTVTTGWVCEDAEITYSVGEYATWSASWNYYPAEE